MKLRVLDLFSGIGGFSLGLERTGGFETVAFCEIEEFPRRVLAKHWPKVPCYHDVRELTADTLRRDGIAVDVICGGFPCQDISMAGKGAGLDGARSGLWSEIVRLIRELRPRFVIVENVAALLGRGLDRVLGDLAALGLDAEWHCIPAAALGARHRRDRIWIVAYPHASEWRKIRRARHGLAEQPNGIPQRQEGPGRSEASREDVADAKRRRLQGRDVECAWSATIIPAAFCGHRRGSEFGQAWRTEPNMGRVAYGVPHGMDRLKGLGNAVVPQIPEMIGRAILEAERSAA
ncbi:DNA cytosine methyltransferase [Ensifer sp. PDNC004]|uniref:DNA cytosine methyltransferase n=1 Tax=Ensifer sp. PDNC004 TaxID=2811423 RepID=UPI0019629B53|nr:DNA cytosine methyltransferase [Ensifer sp. PDNC004]QRY69156.1 DNA cytosine methyltransferase [Ensifer sp. PDNC004]